MKQRILLQLMLLVCVAALPAAGYAATADESIAEFYKGKQLTLFIGTAAGGGYDAYARLIGRYIGTYIPGSPTVVPVNMPGAGGAVLLSHLFTKAARDGTVIAGLQPGAITLPLYSDKKGPEFDVQRLIYLGSANSEDDGCWVRADAPIKSYRDVFSKDLVIGASAPGDSTFDLPTVQNNVLGTKLKIVSGYAGSNEVLLAIDRNEVQGICGIGQPSMMAQRAAWVKNGFIKMLVQENAEGNPELNQAGVPKSVDFAKNPEDRKVLGLIYVQQTFGRPYAMPPDVPGERVAALRTAFVRALEDKRLLAEANRMNLNIAPISGEKLQSIVESIFKTPDDIVQRAKSALGYGGSHR